jgi:hypothetical protein
MCGEYGKQLPKALGLILKERKDLSCRLRLLNFSFVSFVSNISFRFAV